MAAASGRPIVGKMGLLHQRYDRVLQRMLVRPLRFCISSRKRETNRWEMATIVEV